MHPLRELLARTAARDAGRVALVHDSRRWTYAELEGLVAETARDLVRQGVGAGDTVGLMLPNTPELVAAYFAIWELDAVAVEANPALSSNEGAALFNSGGVRTVIATDGVIAARQARRLGEGKAHGTMALLNEDVACVNMTSGSTGAPKGVLLSSRNLVRNAELFVKYFGLRDDDRTCLVLPLYFGMNKIALLAHIQLGAMVLLEPGFVTPNTALATMHREQATGFCAVPAACQALVTRGDLQRYPQPDLRYLRIGAGRVPPPLLEQLQRTLPSTTIYLTYGLTEVGLVTCMTADEARQRPDSVGRVIDEVAVSIEGGGIGEITLRCEHAALGYWGDDDETATTFRDDGVHTGDLGRVDGDGYLYLTGRLKELIKSGGENIYPADVESALLAHDDVAECAVIGVPDRWLGEAVQAFVVLRPGVATTIADLTQYCLAALPPIRRPKRIVQLDSIPRNAVGKVRRDLLASRTDA